MIVFSARFPDQHKERGGGDWNVVVDGSSLDDDVDGVDRVGCDDVGEGSGSRKANSVESNTY